MTSFPFAAAADAVLFGVAGVPRDLGAQRSYDRTFATLARNGVDLFFPTFLYEQAPRPRSLGFESDFAPPCRREDAAFTALREHGLRLIVPANLLYSPSQPLPALDRDPLAALLECAGRDAIHGVLSYDEPAHSGVSDAAAMALYERVKAIAPDLPVLMVHAPLTIDLEASRRAQYLQAVEEISQHADFVGFDVYPVPGSIAKIVAPGSGSTIIEGAEAVEDYMGLIRRLAPGKRYFAVLQNFSYANQLSPEMLETVPAHIRDMARPPSEVEMEAMARRAIESGADLVVWFGGAYTPSAAAPEWGATLDVTRRLGDRY